MFRHPNAGRFSRSDLTALHGAASTANAAFWGNDPALSGALAVQITGAGSLYATPLTGTAALTLTASGLLLWQFYGDATLFLTGSAALTKTALSGLAGLIIAGSATLTKTALARNASINLTLGYAGTVFRGLIISIPAVYRAVYRAWLIKTGETDLELPISSFQARRRDGDPSYLSITVPAPNAYLTAINARSGGQLVIKSGFVNLITNEEVLTELQRVDFDYFRYDLGPRSGSATLSGHRSTAARLPLTVTLRGVGYKAVTNGLRNVRCEPDMYLAPGDIADLGGGETFTVGSISYTVNPRQALMEVQEVEAE